MESLKIHSHKSNDIKLVRYYLIFQVFLLLLDIISSLISKTFNNTVTILSLIIGLFSTLFLIGYLFSNYVKEPLAKEKKFFTNQYKYTKNEQIQIKNAISKCVETRIQITNDEERKHSERNQKHYSLNLSINQRTELAHQAESDKLDFELQKLQEQFIINGLRHTLIKDAKISGFGPASKIKLFFNGITNASDITFTRVENISGFGQSKAQILMDWKNSVESSLNTIKPQQLSPEVVEPIHAFFQTQYNQLNEESELENKNLEIDLKQIHDGAILKHEQNNQNEILLNQSLEVVTEHLSTINNQLLPYSAINFRNYLLDLVGFVIPNKESISKNSIIAILGVLGFLFISQLSVGFGATKAAIIANIPTASPTPTLTPLPTNTCTPTFTLTPTITNTPTITETPTNTFSPTFTFTPTVTLPSVQFVECLPIGTQRDYGTVTKVIDGDTIVVNIGGNDFHVRYIGMDTPELNTDYYGTQAKYANEMLVNGKKVILIKDVSEVDKYQRLLRYIIVDNIFVNDYLVRNGFANNSTYPPDVACNDSFRLAERTAIENKLGFWKPTALPFAPTSPQTTNLLPTMTTLPPQSSGSCNCSIDYNCPDFSTHAQAQACYVSCGGNNWSGLDRDKDGSACELLP